MIPEATQVPDCNLCGSPSKGIVVGNKGRFGMDVRNIACSECGLVQISPRPDHAAMMDYYRGTYRQHYGDVRYPVAGGGTAAAGDPGYDAALEAWHRNQAANAIALGGTQPGARVLEIGCRHARTLTLMRDQLGIEAHGIEPGPEEAEMARRANVQCSTCTLEEYAAEQRFDQIQLFHVLEHFHDPLAQLIRLRALLAPKGKLVIEVPNVYQPYGALEENFFQNVHLYSFSPNTLAALCRRAGLRPLHVLDRGALFAVAASDGNPESALPRPWSRELLPSREEDAAWVAERLATYARLEHERIAFRVQGPSIEALERITQLLARPGFPNHTADCVAEMSEFFVQHGSPRAAGVIAMAASVGPHPPELKHAFRELARVAAEQASRAVGASLG